MGPKEACGLFGIWGAEDAARKAYLGLYALQHRGQESCGIVTSDRKNLHARRSMGLVGEVFREEDLRQLPGGAAMGHVRYSTTGSSRLANVQPLLVSYSRGEIAVAHNGNLVNARSLRDEYEAHGSIFQTTTDSEVIIHLLAERSHSLRDDAFAHCLNHLKGAYSLLFLTPERLIAARDPSGFRPLVLGRLREAYLVASETCAFDQVGAEFLREVAPGEMITLSSAGLFAQEFARPPEVRPARCIFELIYFARPDSDVFGDNVHFVRMRLGERLAREHPLEADVVIPVPDSGYCAALGYSRASGIPFDRGFIRNHYVGRTFIQPEESDRSSAVALKLNVVREVVRDKRLVVVDDSIIRGTTSRARVRYLRAAGAKEVHLRISCPPHRYPCYYGIDFPRRKELIAANQSREAIRDYLGLDSLGYLSEEGMLSAVSGAPDSYCRACFNGRYPVEMVDQERELSDKRAFERAAGG